MTNPSSNNTALKTLNLIHFALLMGMVLFAGIAVFISQTTAGIDTMKENQQLLQVIALGMAAGGYFCATKMYKSKIYAIQSFTNNKEKVDAYRSASILQWALIEAPALFAIVCFLLTANYAFLGLVLLLVLIFMFMKPTREKIMSQTGLTSEELENL